MIILYYIFSRMIKVKFGRAGSLLLVAVCGSFLLSFFCFKTLEIADKAILNFGQNIEIDGKKVTVSLTDKRAIIDYIIDDEDLYDLDTLEISQNATGEFIWTRPNQSFKDYLVGIKDVLLHKASYTTLPRSLIIYDKDYITEVNIDFDTLNAQRNYMLSSTIFLPLIIYFLIIVIISISKLLFFYSKLFSKRVIKSSFDSQNIEKLENFKPGIHFGSIIGLMIALLYIFLINTVFA